MDFQKVNPLNERLNKISGNLLPMTSDDGLFPSSWRIYSAAVLLIEVIQISAMITGIMLVPKNKVLQDGIVPIIITVEVIVLFTRLYTYRGLISQLIDRLNDILRVKDEAMEEMVRSTMKSVEIPLKYYWIVGSLSVSVWYTFSTLSKLFDKSYFFYEDYRIPIVFSKQPFSPYILLLGDFIGLVSTVYIFVRKNALDVYMINILLLMTAQYRYTALKLSVIFREGTPLSQHCKIHKRSSSDLCTETEMNALCRHINTIVQITPIVKKLLSLNFSLIYLCNVFRFCFLGIMIVVAITTLTLLEAALISVYSLGGVVQLYILCYCVHNLLEASTKTTEKAFHEKWYQFEIPLKRTFLLIIMGNNLECKLSTFEMFNLTLPSFMTILNQSYSIALLFIRMK